MILSHQKHAFEALMKLGQTAFGADWNSLPMRPRTNTLIVGPSGSGKSFLAQRVAEECKKPFLTINVAEWVLLTASERGAQATWPMITRWLAAHRTGVIFVDEIDKACGDGGWERWMRTELYRLLDLQVPAGLNTGNSDEESAAESVLAEQALRSDVLILAGGAFQSFWDASVVGSIGFGSESKTAPTLDLSKLAAYLPRELVNRFRAAVMLLPSLNESDYRRMLDETANEMPESLRRPFLRIGQTRIEQAHNDKQGCRFLEEVMLETMMTNGVEVPRRPVGPVVPIVAPKPNNDKTVSDYLAPLIEEDDDDGEF